MKKILFICMSLISLVLMTAYVTNGLDLNLPLLSYLDNAGTGIGLAGLICTGLTEDMLINCDYPMIPGVKDKLILINYDDIDTTQGNQGFLLNGTNPQIIEAIYLKTGKQAYLYEGQRQSINPSSTYTVVDNVTGYVHQQIFKIFDLSPTVKLEFEKLGKNKVLAITANNYKNSTGNSVWELYGKEAGLILSEGGRTANENGGAIMVTVKTLDGYIEPHMPNTIYNTSLAVTDALIDALLIPVS